MQESQQFKKYPKGELNFNNIKVEKAKKGFTPLFNYNNKTMINSEDVGIEYYKKQGFNAEFIENDLWNDFFNILIYPNIKKFYRNSELTTDDKRKFDDEFYRKNEFILNKILISLNGANIKEHIENYYKKCPNELTEEIINKSNVLTASEYLENNQILIVMSHLIKDYIHNRRGFPDLMIWDDKELFFSEIKAGHDFLSRKQITAHKILQNAGINVEVLTINKSKKSIENQKNNYTKERKPTKTDYQGRYKLKVENANRKSEDLKNNNTKEVLNDFKKKFYDKDLNYYIAYLNVLNKNDENDLEKITIEEEDVFKEERLIKYLDIMSKAKALEDKKVYLEAIDKYRETAEDENNPRRFAAYYRICICYTRLNKPKEELSLIKEIINDDSIPRSKKRKFKKRIKTRLKKVKYAESDILCPICKKKHLKYKKHYRTNIKMYRCENCRYMVID